MSAHAEIIPHCRTRQTTEGLEITFRKMPGVLGRSIVQTAEQQGHAPQGQTASVWMVLGQTITLLVKLLVALVVWIYLLIRPSRIRITGTTVEVCGKSWPRDQFGGFFLVQPQQTLDLTGRASESKVSLGYRIGHKTTSFGGTWREYQARDVAAALNAALGATTASGG